MIAENISKIVIVVSLQTITHKEVAGYSRCLGEMYLPTKYEYNEPRCD